MLNCQSLQSTRVRVDTAGRVTLPAQLRHKLGIEPGQELILAEDNQGIRLQTFDHALTAAALRPSTRHLAFSFAERACLATASMHKLTVLTADRDWLKADLGIKIYLIR